MVDDMVMRSVYLKPNEDTQLRQLAHELNVTKSDLIRSAIGIKLREWLKSDDNELILKDLTVGRREAAEVAEPKAKGPRPAKAAGVMSPSPEGAPASKAKKSNPPRQTAL